MYRIIEIISLKEFKLYSRKGDVRNGIFNIGDDERLLVEFLFVFC